MASTPFGVGLGRITPKMQLLSSIPHSFQATCLNAGHGTCNKTFSVAKCGGSADMCNRLLKLWLLLGRSTEGPGNHKHKEAWDRIVVDAYEKDTVPSNADLDAMAATGSDLSAEAPVPARTRLTGKRPEKIETEKHDAAPGLDSGPSTPPDVRARMQERMDRGEIPVSTVEQRRRNKRTAGSEYYYIAAVWEEAIRYNYVSPGLRNPYGWYWRPEPGNKWRLCPQLGG